MNNKDRIAYALSTHKLKMININIFKHKTFSYSLLSWVLKAYFYVKSDISFELWSGLPCVCVNVKTKMMAWQQTSRGDVPFFISNL